MSLISAIWLALIALNLSSPALGADTQCIERWRESPLGQAARERSADQAFLSSQQPSFSLLTGATTAWTDDFLAATVLDLEQRTLSVCLNGRLGLLRDEFQRIYVRRQGWSGPVSEPGILFRGLVNTTNEAHVLKQILNKDKDISKKMPLQALAALYGQAAIVQGVLVVGRRIEVPAVRSLVRRACSGLKQCPFWDPVFLAKILVLNESGVAAYIPETATLRLSREVLEKPLPLHVLVVMHELAHSAIHRQLKRTGVDWAEEFGKLSKWTRAGRNLMTSVVAAPGKKWQDVYSKHGQGSPFSLEGDEVMLPVNSQIDGFVFARTVRRVKESRELSEDLADHIAAYIVAPHRYCFEGTPVAPAKYAWIARHLFGRVERLECQTFK